MTIKRIFIKTSAVAYNFYVDSNGLKEILNLYELIVGQDAVEYVYIEGDRTKEYPLKDDIITLWNYISL